MGYFSDPKTYDEIDTSGQGYSVTSPEPIKKQQPPAQIPKEPIKPGIKCTVISEDATEQNYFLPAFKANVDYNSEIQSMKKNAEIALEKSQRFKERATEAANDFNYKLAEGYANSARRFARDGKHILETKLPNLQRKRPDEIQIFLSHAETFLGNMEGIIQSVKNQVEAVKAEGKLCLTKSKKEAK